MTSDATPAAQGGMNGLQRFALWGLIVLLVGSVAARAAFLGTRTGASPASTLNPAGFVASVESPADEQQGHEGVPGAIETALPYLTEGSLFALIGFALGYASRKVFKLGLLLIAVGFVGLQVLVHYGLLEVEWSRVTQWLNDALLNLKESESVSRFLTNRVPSALALLAGWFLGFQRG